MVEQKWGEGGGYSGGEWWGSGGDVWETWGGSGGEVGGQTQLIEIEDKKRRECEEIEIKNVKMQNI